MGKYIVAGLLVICVTLLADPCDAWARQVPGWSASNGGITYTFNNGIAVTGHGGIRPPNVGLKITIPFGRRRRDASSGEGDTDTISDSSDKDDSDDDVKAEPKSCNECLDVKPLDGSENSLNSLMNQNQFDLVMTASYHEEDFTKRKFKAEMTFTVTDIYKTPGEAVSVGDTFKIDASLTRCPCLKHVESGVYIITGKLDARGNLVISGNLIRMSGL